MRSFSSLCSVSVVTLIVATILSSSASASFTYLCKSGGRYISPYIMWEFSIADDFSEATYQRFINSDTLAISAQGYNLKTLSFDDKNLIAWSPYLLEAGWVKFYRFFFEKDQLIVQSSSLSENGTEIFSCAKQ